MKVALLVGSHMMPIPKDVKVLADWDEVTICTNHPLYNSENHMMVEGEPEAISNWLRPFDGVWVGVGPVMKQFEIQHIK